MSALADYRHPPVMRRALAGIARVACPPEIDELGILDDVVDHVELSMRSLPGLFSKGLVAGITAYEQGARLVPENRGRPASKLDHDRALRYFLRWKRSPVMPQRELVKAVKGLLCVAYYEQPAAKEQIGYTPEAWIDKVKKRRLQVYAGEIERHDASLIEPDPLPLDRLFGRAPGEKKKKKEAV